MERTAPFGILLRQGFGLSRMMFFRGFVWQPVTYMAIHGNLLHMAMNMLVLVMFGAGLEIAIGSRRFACVFLLSGIGGGLGWLLISGPLDICIGASGGVFGMIGAYAALFPHRRVTLLLFWVWPVSVPARLLAIILGLWQLADMLFGVNANVAYAAHLAGGIAGYIYGLHLLPEQRFRRPSWSPRSLLSRWRRPELSHYSSEEPSETPDLDSLLDKINRSGLGSLSPKERRALQDYARHGLAGNAGQKNNMR